MENGLETVCSSGIFKTLFFTQRKNTEKQLPLLPSDKILACETPSATHAVLKPLPQHLGVKPLTLGCQKSQKWRERSAEAHMVWQDYCWVDSSTSLTKTMFFPARHTLWVNVRGWGGCSEVRSWDSLWLIRVTVTWLTVNTSHTENSCSGTYIPLIWWRTGFAALRRGLWFPSGKCVHFLLGDLLNLVDPLNIYTYTVTRWRQYTAIGL